MLRLKFCVPAFLLASLLCAPSRAAAVSADDQAAAMHRGNEHPGRRSDVARPAGCALSSAPFRAGCATRASTRCGSIFTPFCTWTPQGGRRAAWLAALDRLTKAGLDAGLTVVLDEHDDIACARDADDCLRQLRAVWNVLAPRYRNAPRPVAVRNPQRAARRAHRTGLESHLAQSARTDPRDEPRAQRRDRSHRHEQHERIAVARPAGVRSSHHCHRALLRADPIHAAGRQLGARREGSVGRGVGFGCRRPRPSCAISTV